MPTATNGGFPDSNGAPAGSSGGYAGAFVPSGWAATTGEPDVYVYRDDGAPDEPVPAPADTPGADERDADYWYGPAEPEQPKPQQEARGPFEPARTGEAAGGYVPGEWIPPDPQLAPSADAWAPVADETVDEDLQDADRHAQKLEQIKDFYMTAEAIGEENVDKHFDQLLAQQRDLLDQYFKDAKDRIVAAAHDENTSTAIPPGENAPDSTASAAT